MPIASPPSSDHVYAEIPVRVEYTLTPLGWQLTEPLMALYEWAVAHENDLSAAAMTDAPVASPRAALAAAAIAALP